MEGEEGLIVAKEAVSVMLPVVRRLSGGDGDVSRLIWRQYFQDTKVFAGIDMEERAEKMRRYLGEELGCVVPEKVKKGFWNGRKEGVVKLLAESPKARVVGK